MARLGHRVGSARVYTMRELNQSTADVIREINESGEPAAITRRGRFVALITPLVDRQVEAVAVAAAVQMATNAASLLGEEEVSQSYTADEVASDLGVHLPS